MAEKVEFVNCGNEKCNSRVMKKIAVHSIGNRKYCTVRCLNETNGRRQPARIVRIHR